MMYRTRGLEGHTALGSMSKKNASASAVTATTAVYAIQSEESALQWRSQRGVVHEVAERDTKTHTSTLVRRSSKYYVQQSARAA